MTSLSQRLDTLLKPRQDALNKVETLLGRRSQRTLATESRALLKRAEALVRDQDLSGVKKLRWGANQSISELIARAMITAAQNGKRDGLAELKAAIKDQDTDTYARNLDDQIRLLLDTTPAGVPNAEIEAEIRSRSQTLAGNYTDKVLEQIKGHIIAAIAPQSDGRPISKPELQRRIQATLNVSKARANAIMRTETTRAYNSGRVASFRASPLVTHVRFNAVMDDRTTEDICRPLNGKVVAVSEVNQLLPPLHVNCRSVVQALMPAVNPAHRRAVEDSNNRAPWSATSTQTPPNQRQEAAPPTTTKAPTPMPTTLDGLEEVEDLGGSTGAKLVRDPITGQRYVLKRGASPDHIRSEFVADQLYRALGVNVPEGVLIDDNGVPVKLTRFIENAQPLGNLSQSERKRVIERLQNDFALDALLGNWDVIGMGQDNILVDDQGIPWRVDNGGALDFRAQGEPKGSAWNDYPTELWSMRERNSAFASINHDQMIRSIERLGNSRQSLLDAAPEELRGRLGRRFDEMTRLAEISRTLEADSFIENYRDSFTRESLGLRAADIIDRIPDRMKFDRNAIPFDSEGRDFDHFRGQDSIIEDFVSYLEQQGYDKDFPDRYWREQKNTSWDTLPRIVKTVIAESRTLDIDEYFWRYNPATGITQEQRNAVIATHAFNYEVISKMDTPNNDLQNKAVTLYRTENPKVLQDAGVSLNQPTTMTRGAAESASLYRPVDAIAGEELTVQQVPHHRIFFLWMTGQTSYMDHENEVVFIPEGLEFEYLGNLKRVPKSTYPKYSNRPKRQP